MTDSEVFLHRLDLAEARAKERRDYYFRRASQMHVALTRLRAVTA